jgi:hypothetical protein
MTLKDIAAIAGKPGLYHVLKPTRTGMVVESMDEKKTKLVVNAHQRVSLLQEISVYVTGRSEEAVPLSEVLLGLDQYYKNKLDINLQNSDALAEMLANALPDFDRQRVYTSDMKKLASWYMILADKQPKLIEALKQEVKEEAKAEEKEANTE